MKLFESDEQIADHWVTAIRPIHANYRAYAAARQAERGKAEWPDTAAQVVACLERK
jgi:hypothetical protein